MWRDGEKPSWNNREKWARSEFIRVICICCSVTVSIFIAFLAIKYIVRFGAMKNLANCNNEWVKLREKKRNQTKNESQEKIAKPHTYYENVNAQKNSDEIWFECFFTLPCIYLCINLHVLQFRTQDVILFSIIILYKPQVIITFEIKCHLHDGSSVHSSCNSKSIIIISIE